ncbi:MAG TPA: radical SAM protein [Firmicutes bacterium]|nr:radical SAM protein [Bacillota bacterium]
MNFEQGPIRPPSEADSLFVRVTRNCPWNKCLFCHVYKGKKFSRRSVEEIKDDILAMERGASRVESYALKIDSSGRITREVLEYIYHHEPNLLQIAFWLYRGGKNVFLQDGDNLTMPADKLAEILIFIREQFPTVERITTYTRAKTAGRRSVAELAMLKEAGLTRVHVGLETGYNPLLDYMRKGITAEEHIEAGLKIKEAGLSLSEYVILGLGGRSMWKEHALETAKVLSKIDPNFIRLRTLAMREDIPLLEKVHLGEFQLSNDDEIVVEEKLLLENLHGTGYLVSDHILNLLEDVEGNLARDKTSMLKIIDNYLSLPAEERANFCLGRRLGIYRYMRDMEDAERYEQVSKLRRHLIETGQDQDEFLIQYRGNFI